jgi:hypothetical protein
MGRFYFYLTINGRHIAAADFGLQVGYSWNKIKYPGGGSDMLRISVLWKPTSATSRIAQTVFV